MGLCRLTGRSCLTGTVQAQGLGGPVKKQLSQVTDVTAQACAANAFERDARKTNDHHFGILRSNTLTHTYISGISSKSIPYLDQVCYRAGTIWFLCTLDSLSQARRPQKGPHNFCNGPYSSGPICSDRDWGIIFWLGGPLTTIGRMGGVSFAFVWLPEWVSVSFLSLFNGKQGVLFAPYSSTPLRKWFASPLKPG